MNPNITKSLGLRRAKAETATEAAQEGEATAASPFDLMTRQMDPSWIPTPAERRQLMLDVLRNEIRKFVRFDEVPENVFWDRFFFDDATNTVAIRTEFRDGPGAVEFHFNERAELKSVSGRGVKDLHIVKDVDLIPETDPFAIPDPFTPQKPR